MSHKQAKRLRREEREQHGSCELDRRREASRLRNLAIEEQRQALAKLKREDPETYNRRVAADREKFRRVTLGLISALSVIVR